MTQQQPTSSWLHGIELVRTPPIWPRHADAGWYAAELSSVLDDATTTLEQSLSDAPDVQNSSQRLFAQQMLEVGVSIVPQLRLNADQAARYTGRLSRVSGLIGSLPAGAVNMTQAEQLSERISTLNDDLATAANIDTTTPETTKGALSRVEELQRQVGALAGPGMSTSAIRTAYRALIQQLRVTTSGIATIDPSAVGRVDQSLGLSLRHAVTGSVLPVTIDSSGKFQPGLAGDAPTILATVGSDLETLVTEMKDEIKALAQG